MSSLMHPEVCLLSDDKPIQVDNPRLIIAEVVILFWVTYFKEKEFIFSEKKCSAVANGF